MWSGSSHWQAGGPRAGRHDLCDYPYTGTSLVIWLHKCIILKGALCSCHWAVLVLRYRGGTKYIPLPATWDHMHDSDAKVILVRGLMKKMVLTITGCHTLAGRDDGIGVGVWSTHIILHIISTQHAPLFLSIRHTWISRETLAKLTLR